MKVARGLESEGSPAIGLFLWSVSNKMAGSRMEQDMNGKIAVITGATSGIGRAAAERLAEMGARIVLVARDPQRGEVTLKRLQECGPGAVHTAYYADLSSLSESREHDECARLFPCAIRIAQVSLISANAGGIAPSDLHLIGAAAGRTIRRASSFGGGV